MLLIMAITGCETDYSVGTFGYDVNLLREKTETVVLQDGVSHVAVTSDFQGRVMTSTSQGYKGSSYGWFDRKLIRESDGVPPSGGVGGEDRLWFGPEYGRFSLFFKPGVRMVAENVSVPAPLTSGSFELSRHTKKEATFSKRLDLTNYQGTEFNIYAERDISILSQTEIERELKTSIPDDVSYVGFQSVTTLKNEGSDWSKETGLLSIWVLGVFPSSKTATVVLPVEGRPDSITSYWSAVGPDRLKIAGNSVFYRGDAEYLHKIGVRPKNIKPVMGSYDAESRVLTIVRFSFSNEANYYVNSRWIEQKDPFAGDVINVFNNGPRESGEPFGPFYELESSSYTYELKRGDSLKHRHATFHFEGNKSSLDEISRKTLKVGLEEIISAFKT